MAFWRSYAHLIWATTERKPLIAATIGEIKKGIEKLADSARQERLRGWLVHNLIARFDQRIHGRQFAAFAL